MSIANAAYANDEFELDSETYKSQGSTPLPPPGNYRIKVTSVSKKSDENGNPVLIDEKYPIFRINRIEVLEPMDQAGSFAVFQDVTTKPFKREGTKGASQAADVLVAVDETALEGLGSFEDVAAELESRLKSNSVEANVYIGYTGYDKAFVDATKQKNPNMSKEEVNKMYSTARLNTKSFRLPTGEATTTAKGPSGETVEAKLKITSWLPSGQKVELGPTKAKGQK